LKAQQLLNPFLRHILGAKVVKGVISRGVIEVLTMAKASSTIGGSCEVTSISGGSTTLT